MKIIEGSIQGLRDEQQFLKSANKPLELIFKGIDNFLRLDVLLLFFAFIDIWFHDSIQGYILFKALFYYNIAKIVNMIKLK